MATPFTDTCSVAVTNTYDTCGSLTKASISTLTPEQIKALFTDGSTYNELNSLLKHQFEMKACGVRRNGFYDWIMTSNKPGMGKLINIERRDRSASLVQPFIKGRQMSVINTDFFVISNGYATAAYTPGTTGPLTSVAGGNRVIRVTPGYGTYIDAGQLLGDLNGRGGHSLFILNKSGGGTAQKGQWRIKESAISTDGLSVDILLVDQNAGSVNTAASPSSYDSTPITGVVVIGINNVGDVEQWCKNPANYNPAKLVPFWYQTYRRTRCVDDQYLAVQKQLLADNQYFSQFVDLPIAERNRQDEMEEQRQFINQFLFGKSISADQTLTGWGALEQITSVSGASIDPGTGGKLISYRAGMIGVYEQLKACDQTIDVQGAALSMVTFLETYIYNIYRNRQSQGSPSARSIDVYTDVGTANDFMKRFITYAKTYGIDNVNLQLTEQDMKSDMAPLGFLWRSFRLFKPGGVVLNIISHETFDDLRNVFVNLATGTDTTSGRYLMVLDLGKGGSIYPAILSTNRKVYKTGELDQLARIDSTFSCVMENPTQIKTLNSQTVTAVVECPKNSIIVENFSSIGA